ncbi:MAG: type VII toxin-antitoxin system MntA family adenylyltransferase antitoxin [Gammaproteobacteria bacterium]
MKSNDTMEVTRVNGVSEQDATIQTVLSHYPDTQAIYLFGSYGTTDEWPDSDVDIALLLPAGQARVNRMLVMSPLWTELESLLKKPVDLINLRETPTVFQKEIIAADRRIYTGDAYAADEFEMLVLSFYQKLGEERAEILAEGLRSGRFYNV